MFDYDARMTFAILGNGAEVALTNDWAFLDPALDLAFENEIYCRLWQLDFRRAVVRTYGSRGRWHLRLTLTWTTALDFVIFYRALQFISAPIYKPTFIGTPLEM